MILLSLRIKVFVYGTLKPKERNYPIYCQEKVIEPAIEVYTLGMLYHLPTLGYPAMTRGNQKVKGYVLTFRDETIFDDLDPLENYDWRRSPAENYYNRDQIPIYDLNDYPLGNAWGYIMSLETVKLHQGILIPSGWWREIVNS